MSRLCRLEAREKGVFVLTLGSDGSHNYLTDDTITDLLENLEKIQNNAAVKRLVTTCESEAGTFCDGLNYDNLSEFEVERLVERFAMVIRLLLELPIPTVAAVRGRATSLGQALVLAHDHCFVWEHALFGLPEAQFGYPLPDYLTTLLREKLARKRHGKSPRKWPRHGTEGDREVVLNKAIDQLHSVRFFAATIVTKNRKMECPDTFAAVEVATRKSVEEAERSRTDSSRLKSASAPPRKGPAPAAARAPAAAPGGPPPTRKRSRSPPRPSLPPPPPLSSSRPERFRDRDSHRRGGGGSTSPLPRRRHSPSRRSPSPPFKRSWRDDEYDRRGGPPARYDRGGGRGGYGDDRYHGRHQNRMADWPDSGFGASNNSPGIQRPSPEDIYKFDW